MSDHDSGYATDYSTDFDPPRQHPLLAAMDRITASVAAASITPPQSSLPPQPQKDPDTTRAQLQVEAAAQPEAQPEVTEKLEKWPVIPIRDFTIFTINAIKNGEMEDEAEKTSMSEKYNAYCHDHELMKPVLNVLANSDQETQDMVHQLVHTMLDNLGTGYGMEQSSSDIPRDICRLRKDFGILHFHCLNRSSYPVTGPSSAAIVSCLASYTRLAHSLHSKLDAKENQHNIFTHVKRIMEIAKKESNGEELTQEEKDLNERDGDKSMSELEDELGLKQTPDLERFVIHVAAFAELCINEAERQAEAQTEKDASKVFDKKGEEGRKEGVEDEEEEGDSNSTIKVT